MSWIVVRNASRQILDASECSDPQKAFARKCEELHGQGWTLEQQRYGWRFAHRGDERIFIAIEGEDPRAPSVPHATPGSL